MRELTIFHAKTTDIDRLHGDNFHAICMVDSAFCEKNDCMFGHFVKKPYLCKVLRSVECGGKSTATCA